MAELTHAQRTAIKIAMAQGKRLPAIATELGITVEDIRSAVPKYKDCKPSLARQGVILPQATGRPYKGRTVARAKQLI